MTETVLVALFGNVTSLLVAIISLFAGRKLEIRKYKIQDHQLWKNRRYETLKQILNLFDRMIAYSGTSDRAIYQCEKTSAEDAEEQWQEILKLRRELVPDVEILFDAKTIQEFENVFDDIWNCAHTVSRNGEGTNYGDIVDEVNAFAHEVRKKYLMKDE